MNIYEESNIHFWICESKILIEWFQVNKMQANPDKFQVLAVDKKIYDKNPSMHIQNS